MTDNNKDALLPCPFCGASAARVDIDATDENEPNAGGSYIHCTSCDASSPIHFDRKENLISSWNERTDRVKSERNAIADEARRYAAFYPQSSDGKNTFILLAEWIEAREATP